MEIKQIQAGKPQEIDFNGKAVSTAIKKKRIYGAVMVEEHGLESDEQADKENHGGADKALCAYPYEHYAFWDEKLQRGLPDAAFGENLTLSGLTEQEVHIGDQFAAGEALLEVTQPRQPCYKLAAKYNMNELPAIVKEEGRTGWYFRVLQPGTIEEGMELQRVLHRKEASTIEHVNHLLYNRHADPEEVKALSEDDRLAASCRRDLLKRWKERN
ncbi:MOSC domain-containing protein [Alkalicoccus chagannorensis]|uniref:MOSC domain-containing protein n=1 Tax=Alkalicoccus chagannorensis TaxID=427072 RepID=UPI00041664FB|nr:MOSC domain-containing protein [Alkalicoccus chagannorensis]